MLEALKLILNDYCEKVVPNLFRNSASISAKKDNIVSYPTHIINAVFTAASLYAYEHLNPESENSIRELKLLISVVTLHDIGKYLGEKCGLSDRNSIENIKKYFENDDFKLREFFPEIDTIDLNEIAWLIQNTELKDETQHETIGHRTEFGRLADYSRLGDKIASLTKDEFYVSKIFDTLKYHDIHVVQIPKFPQFTIRRELLKTLVKYYEEKGAIPFLLYEDGLFYIHKDKITPELSTLIEYLMINIKELRRLSAKNDGGRRVEENNEEDETEVETNESQEEEEEESILSLRVDFQSIDDNSILNFPLPKEDKKRMILEQIIRNIPRAMRDFTITLPLIPSDVNKTRELQENISTIVYYIYKSEDIKIVLKKKLGKNDFQKIEEILNEPIREKIKSIRDKIGSQKYKLHMAKELYENHGKYNIDEVYNKCNEFLNKQLDSTEESDVFNKIVKNISIDFQHVFEAGETPRNKEELCFLCGSKAVREYRAGKNYFLKARSDFSKRGKVFDAQKKICSLCLIEKDLIESLLINRNYRPTGDYLFAIFYFDRIWANVSYFSREFSNVPIESEVSITEEQRFRLGNFDGMYFVMPYPSRGKEDSAKQSSRVNITKQILDFINGYGSKATLAPPYTLLRTYNELFVNENPTRLEISLEVHSVSDFDELDKKRQFLNAIYDIDRRKGYFTVQSYNLFSFIHFIKLKSNGSKRWIKDEYFDVVKNCFRGEIMKIDEIAKIGKELYSTGRVEWESSYKRTVLMRTALDAMLVGLQQRFPEEELKTFVSAQIYKLAMREEYAKKKDADKYVKDFVDSLIQYLKEKNWYSVSSLSSIEKYLVNTYEFALISISKQTASQNQLEG